MAAGKRLAPRKATHRKVETEEPAAIRREPLVARIPGTVAVTRVITF